MPIACSSRNASFVVAFSAISALSVISSSSRGRHEPVLRERGRDVEHEPRLLELQRRKIDRDADLARPFRGGSARFAQRPVAERADHAHFLGDRNEIGRRHRAAHRMLPAQKRLDADELAGLERDEWLIDERELARIERFANVEAQLAPELHHDIHLGA